MVLRHTSWEISRDKAPLVSKLTLTILSNGTHIYLCLATQYGEITEAIISFKGYEITVITPMESVKDTGIPPQGPSFYLESVLLSFPKIALGRGTMQQITWDLHNNATYPFLCTVHPPLLPAFQELSAHSRSLSTGLKVTGWGHLHIKGRQAAKARTLHWMPIMMACFFFP